jgi:hypothetical protein
VKAIACALLLAAFAPPAIAADMLPPGHPPVDSSKRGGAADARLPQKGTVVSVIDVPQYTYLEVRQDNKSLWLATSTVAARKGDVIRFDDGVTMTNFHSKTLNRTFPSIQFVNHVAVEKK